MSTKNSSGVWKPLVKGSAPVGPAFQVGCAKSRKTACVVSRGPVLVDVVSGRALSWEPTHFAPSPSASSLPEPVVAKPKVEKSSPSEGSSAVKRRDD